jgi:hypothetical protein
VLGPSLAVDHRLVPKAACPAADRHSTARSSAPTAPSERHVAARRPSLTRVAGVAERRCGGCRSDARSVNEGRSYCSEEHDPEVQSDGDDGKDSRHQPPHDLGPQQPPGHAYGAGGWEAIEELVDLVRRHTPDSDERKRQRPGHFTPT